MDKLTTISNSIKRLEGLYLVNNEFYSDGENKEILETIESLKQMRGELLNESYAQKVKAFRDYMASMLPSDEEPDSEVWNDFYDMDFKITFGDKQLTLHNEAGSYQGILDLLTDLINDYI